MSLVLSSSNPQLRVKTHGIREAIDAHEVVYLNNTDVALDVFIEMAKAVIEGKSFYDAPNFTACTGHGVSLDIDKEDDVSKALISFSWHDFFCMVEYVVTNTDLYGQIDPRPGFVKWIAEQPNEGAGGMDRKLFLILWKKWKIDRGHNSGSMSISRRR